MNTNDNQQDQSPNKIVDLTHQLLHYQEYDVKNKSTDTSQTEKSHTDSSSNEAKEKTPEKKDGSSLDTKYLKSEEMSQEDEIPKIQIEKNSNDPNSSFKYDQDVLIAKMDEVLFSNKTLTAKFFKLEESHEKLQKSHEKLQKNHSDLKENHEKLQKSHSDQGLVIENLSKSLEKTQKELKELKDLTWSTISRKSLSYLLFFLFDVPPEFSKEIGLDRQLYIHMLKIIYDSVKKNNLTLQDNVIVKISNKAVSPSTEVNNTIEKNIKSSNLTIKKNDAEFLAKKQQQSNSQKNDAKDKNFQEVILSLNKEKWLPFLTNVHQSQTSKTLFETILDNETSLEEKIHSFSSDYYSFLSVDIHKRTFVEILLEPIENKVEKAIMTSVVEVFVNNVVNVPEENKENPSDVHDKDNSEKIDLKIKEESIDGKEQMDKILSDSAK